MFAKTYREGKASGEERRAAHLQLVDDSLELLLRISERLIESLEEVLGTLELVRSQRFGGGGSGRGRGGDLPGVDERVPKNPPREVLLLRGGEEACGGPENESQREGMEREREDGPFNRTTKNRMRGMWCESAPKQRKP
jgi:hypothetical protein